MVTGLLVFSPNWGEDPGTSAATELANSKSNSVDAVAYVNATQCIIPLHDYVVESYKESCMVMTMPWVVEFLRMMKWDLVSKASDYYRSVLGKI